MKKINKIVSILILAITLLLQFSNIILAVTEISKADITYDKDCGDHLEANDGDGEWYTILASYVEYEAPNRKKIPCLLLRQY